MILHVIEAVYERDYIIRLKFNDGAEGFVDLSNQLFGEMFKPLKDLQQFRDFTVDSETNTVVWANGADFAPEFLHQHLLVAAQDESSAGD